ncbi:MAG: hypothetical protein ACREB5_10310 [Sphingomonadaceae bacterium]
MATSNDQVEILSVLMDPVMQALGNCSKDGEVSSDDILDLFALAIATVIDNDSHLKTPGDLRQGVATAAQRIEEHVRALRVAHELSGISTFTQLLAAARSEGMLTGALN